MKKQVKNIDNQVETTQNAETVKTVLTKEQKLIIANELLKEFGTVSNIKRNRGVILESRLLSKSDYISIEADCKIIAKQSILNAAKGSKERTFSYSNILSLVFDSLSKDGGYQYLVNTAKCEGLNATTFVQKYYSYIGSESLEILALKKFTDGKYIYTYFVPVERLTDTFALGVLKTSLGNFSRELTQRIKKSEFLHVNKFVPYSLKGVNVLEKDDKGTAVCGAGVVLEPKELAKVTFETLQTLSDFNKA